MSEPDTEPHIIESFEIENPPNIYQKRGSAGSNNYDEIDSNDNIIFETEVSSVDVGIKAKNTIKKVYCGISGDSEISAILNIVVSAIGGGWSTFPYLMYEGGIIVSLLSFLFVTICIAYSVDLLRSFVVDTKYFSFALMTETILGSQWLKLYAVSSFIMYVSMEVSYLSTIYIYIKEIILSNSVWSRFIYYFISIVIEIIICIYISKVAKMHLLSIISISCFFIILLALIIISILANIKIGVKKKFTPENLFFPGIDNNSTSKRLFKIASYIMDYVYGYSYHSTFPTLLGNLNTVTHSSTQKVHLISFGLIFAAYLLTTFFGFIMYDEVPTEMFKENKEEKYFKGDWNILIIPFKCVLCVYLLTLIPIRFIVLRDNYITLIGEKKITFLKELLIITIFIFICNILVFGFDLIEIELISDYKTDIKSIIQAFGGIFGVIICFCLPVVNYVSVNGKRKIKSIIGYIITGIFIIIAIFSCASSFEKLIFIN